MIRKALRERRGGGCGQRLCRRVMKVLIELRRRPDRVEKAASLIQQGSSAGEVFTTFGAVSEGREAEGDE